MARNRHHLDDHADSLHAGEPLGLHLDRHSSDDWHKPEPPPRDWKKAVLVFGLGALSWVATYVGMLELIESNMGTLPLQHRVIIGCAVAMLMIMIVWLLDQIFSPGPFARKVVYAGGYLFLTLISVGFGFGFYWKVLESRSEATRSAQSAVGQVQTAMHAGSTRLEQLNATLQSLRQMSERKAQQEREFGSSCPNSRPGDGPRRKLRDADAQKFAFASQFVSGRIETLKSELNGLDGELAKVSEDDPSTVDETDGTRNEFMRALDRKLDLSVAGFNAFRTDPQLLQIRQDLAARAEKTIFPTGKGGTFTCPDPQLQAALRGVVRAIDQLPQLGKPKVAAVEGSEATIEAFRRLSTTLMGVATFELPPSPEDLRAMQRKAVQSASQLQSPARAVAEAPPAGLSKRDYIPLALAIFVDLCLLLVSMGRPTNRFASMVDKMREAEKGPVIRILSRFNDIHRDAEVRQNFEMFRHVVFDHHGAYYVAVPLDTPYNRIDPRSGRALHYGASDAQDLQHEAHLLSNLFASFEKEKIFTRVYSPLLTTRVIQKRLARQGSKFSGSSAFRLYRFKDGAWSDIILGAVMGAARRVEEEQRRTGRRRASMPAEQRPMDARRPDVRDERDHTAAERPESETSHRHDERSGDRQTASHKEPIDRQAEHSPFIHDPRHRPARRRAPWQAPSNEQRRQRPQPPATEERQEDTAAFQSQFGSYAASARAELDGQGAPFVSDEPLPANNNTRPSQRHQVERAEAQDDNSVLDGAETDHASDQRGIAVDADPRRGPDISTQRDAQVIALPQRLHAATPRNDRAGAAQEHHGGRNPRAAKMASGSHPAAAAVPAAAPTSAPSSAVAAPSLTIEETAAAPIAAPPPLPATEVAASPTPIAERAPEAARMPNGVPTNGASPVTADQTQVTLTRETATFSLPASEADLPAQLLQAARSGMAQVHVETQNAQARLPDLSGAEAGLVWTDVVTPSDDDNTLQQPIAIAQPDTTPAASFEEAAEPAFDTAANTGPHTGDSQPEVATHPIFDQADDDFADVEILPSDDGDTDFIRTMALRLKPESRG